MNDTTVRDRADARPHEPLPAGPSRPELYDCLQVNLASLAEHETQAAPSPECTTPSRWHTRRTPRAAAPKSTPCAAARSRRAKHC